MGDYERNLLLKLIGLTVFLVAMFKYNSSVLYLFLR